MRSLRIGSVVGVALLATGPAFAQDASCASQIDRLASQYGLSADLPKAGPEPGDENAIRPQVTQDELKRSGGVIAPSTNPPARVISPDKDIDPQMAKPRAEPAQPNANSSPPGDHVAAARRTQMQGLIDAARQEEKRGNEQACREKVAQALALARASSEPG